MEAATVGAGLIVSFFSPKYIVVVLHTESYGDLHEKGMLLATFSEFSVPRTF